MKTWQSVLNDDENGEIKVGHGSEKVCATLETSGRNFPVYYHGDGDTVEEALAALDRDIAYQDGLTRGNDGR